MKKTWYLIILTILLACLVAGCSVKEAGQSASDLPALDSQIEDIVEESEPEPSPSPSIEPKIVAPLTGLPVEQEITARPIAVLINNLAPARPQSGLTEADVVWEVLAEGGITRLVAVFNSTEKDDFDIGPVRSNRPYLIDIADSYNAVISHAGASNDAYAILQKQKKPYLDEITNAGSFYWRSKERKAPHNLYTNLLKLREGINKKGYDELADFTAYSFLKLSELENIQVGQAKTIDVKFQLSSYKVSYTYNEQNGLYTRFINGEEHIDKNNNEALAVKNLIFFQTEHIVLDSEGRLKVDLSSGGKALVIHDGNVKEAEWIRAKDGMIRFTSGGNELALAPGKSFIHVLPLGKTLEEHIKW